MNKLNLSSKYVAINKSNAQMVGIVGVASFITVFCLFASKSVLSQYQYEGHVISKSRNADNQLKVNINSYNKLVNSYNKFDSGNPSIIGTSVSGNTNDNAQVILDSLPGHYDFPGLTSGVENILHKSGAQISSFTGTDQQLSQVTGENKNPQPVSMPFGVTITNGTYQSIQQVIQDLQNSIRPISVDTLNINAQQSSLTLTLTAHSYYLPAKVLTFTQEVVK